MTVLREEKPTVVLIMVMSANGVVARKRIENSFDWNSEADRKQFIQRVSDIGTAVMGSNTYRSIGCQPYEGVDLFVLTHHPEQFRSHDRVTFVTGDVQELYLNWRKTGLKKIALLGGPTTNSLFLEQDLVDEIFLTVEPKILPDGLHFAENLRNGIHLKLNKMNILNEQKTLLLHYSVIKNDFSRP